MDVEIRRAHSEDLPTLADTLAAAFAAYPWTRWTVDERDHQDRLRALYGIYLDLALGFGQVWMTGDGAGAAAWIWSAHQEAMARSMRERGLDARVGELAGDRAEAAAMAGDLLAGRAPDEPHWYLAAVGVAPGRQGGGLGTRLLRPVLDRCDAEGTIAALDTSSPDNVRLYERLGFVVHDEVDVPEGPRLWFMRRRSAAP